MKQYIKQISWFLYGGASCYCLQRFLIDFVHMQTNVNELFQSGDIIVLDVWNRLDLYRNNLIYAISPHNHQQRIFGQIVAISNETININPVNHRVKIVQVPKGSVAVEILSSQTSSGKIEMLPLGLIEGKILGRIWPLKRFSSRLSTRPTSDI